MNTQEHQHHHHSAKHIKTSDDQVEHKNHASCCAIHQANNKGDLNVGKDAFFTCPMHP